MRRLANLRTGPFGPLAWDDGRGGGPQLTPYDSSRMWSALRSIFAFSDFVRFPSSSCWDALAFAFAACDLSGIGYLRSSGSPNSDLGSLSRFLVLRSAIAGLLSASARCRSGVPPLA